MAHSTTSIPLATCTAVKTFISQVLSLTRGQSNLAKSASNAPHMLHALESLASAIPEIHGGGVKNQQ